MHRLRAALLFLKGPVGLYVAMAAFSLCGSALCRWLNLDPMPVARPAAILTLATACFAAFYPLFRSASPRDRNRSLYALGFVLLIGMGAELFGLYTGFPFGWYRYTELWWPVVQLPTVGFFPLLLPFAWMLIAGCAYLACSGVRGGVWLAALLATAVDQVMEPVMTGRLDYWYWVDSGPLLGHSPWENAAGWFAVSLLAALGMSRILSKRPLPRAVPATVLAVHVVLVIGIGELIPVGEARSSQYAQAINPRQVQRGSGPAINNRLLKADA